MAETYTLKHPITLTLKGANGERTDVIKALELDFPKDGVLRAKHLRETDGHQGQVGMTLALIALFSGQPMRVMDELADTDFTALFELIEDFRKPGQTTGETV